MAISLACKRNPYILWGVAHRSSSSYSRPLGQSIHSRRKTQRLNRTFLLPPSLAVPFLLATTFSAVAQKPPFAGADVFVQKSCAGCHNSVSHIGGLDLTKLAWEPANADNFTTWVKIHDRVSAGEMPPAGMARPAGESQFVKDLAAALTGYELSLIHI